MIKKHKKAIFARNGSRPVPRAVRMMRVASELGYESIFCGALRDNDLKRHDTWGGVQLVRVGPHFPLLNGKGLLLYIKSVVAYNIAFYKFLRLQKPDMIQASDFEAMPASIIYALFNRVRFIYNIHDNLSQRYNVPRPLAIVLNIVEGVFVMFSDQALVPEEFRRDALPKWCRKKVAVVKNTPGEIDFIEPPPFIDGKIRIFMAGWLDWGRGVQQLVNLAEKFTNIDLIIAGDGDPDIEKYLESHPRVTYLGFIEHEQSLIEAGKSHFIPSFYKPDKVINRYAASNKFAESLAIGRPLLLNSEMEVGKFFKDCNCMVNKKYADLNNIGGELTSLSNDPERYLLMCHNARKVFEQHYSWSVAKQKMIDIIAGRR